MPRDSNDKKKADVVAIIPAAGFAKRISPLPCSKEIYPIGLDSISEQRCHPKVISEYLLEKIEKANINQVYICLRKGKTDILEYFGGGGVLGLDIAYLIVDKPRGAPFSIDCAYNFVAHSNVVLGFPDIIFEADEAFNSLLDHLDNCNADLVLGLFPTLNPRNVDLIETDGNNRVTNIEIKPKTTSLKYTWGIAAWKPTFSHYMHEYVQGIEDNNIHEEWYVGNIISAAIDSDLQVDGICISEQPFIDIGTPEDLKKAVAYYVRK